MNIIKKFIDFIKKIYKKESNSPIIEKSELNMEKELEEILSYKYNALFNEIKIGDIIWAKRYSSQEEKDIIPDGHQEGPFIVLTKEDNNLICSYGTSVIPTQNFQKYFFLDNKYYNLTKMTYFRLYKLRVINENNFIKKIDTLGGADLDKLIKIRNQLNNKDNYNYVSEPLNLKSGDIIGKNKSTYIIIDIDSEKIRCLKIPNGDYRENIDYLSLNNLNYSRIAILNEKERIYYINSVSNTFLLYLLKKYKEHLNYIKNQTIPQRGSLVHRKGNKDYYIFGEEGQEWLTFKINHESNPNPDLTTIKIKKEIYYTDFKDIKINKNVKLKAYYLCTKEERDFIKQERKNYKMLEKERRYLKIRQRKKN